MVAVENNQTRFALKLITLGANSNVGKQNRNLFYPAEPYIVTQNNLKFTFVFTNKLSYFIALFLKNNNNIH